VRRGVPLFVRKSLELSGDDVLSSGPHEDGNSSLVHGAGGNCLISDVSSFNWRRRSTSIVLETFSVTRDVEEEGRSSCHECYWEE
jgi:hypothetical protein